MSFKIVGLGSSLPEQIVTNHHLSEFLDTSDEWISERTGVRQRRILKDETLLSHAVAASKSALADAGVEAKEIDLIIFATLQGDYVSPAASCLLAKEIGAVCNRMMDVNMGCSGFLFALDHAQAYFRAGMVKRVLIVCAEALSKFVDWTDRSMCVLFGDGAGAVVLAEGDALRFLDIHVDGAPEHLNIPKTTGNSPFSQESGAASFIHMNGQEIYKFATTTIYKDVTRALEEASLTPDDITYFLLHQANKRIIDSARDKLKQPTEKFPVNIDKYGNTSAATLPILMDEMKRDGRLKRGDKVVLCAFGAGLTSGIVILDIT